jgi:Domain of unknown function (DUF5655)/Domain of unknown function (DUF4287)
MPGMLGKPTKTKGPWDVHPGVAMVAKWVDELPAKTGKSLDEWADAIRRKKFAEQGPARDWLKKEHGFGTNAAWWIAQYTLDKSTWDGDPKLYLKQAAGFVETMFAGPKAVLKPLFDEVVAFARSMGKDVCVCPCKTIVPFYRNRKFAELTPATKIRLELTLALDETPFTGKMKLNPRAKGNDKLRHMFEIFEPKDFSAEAKNMLKKAYALDAE